VYQPGTDGKELLHLLYLFSSIEKSLLIVIKKLSCGSKLPGRSLVVGGHGGR
jgi:hypothetical protein